MKKEKAIIVDLDGTLCNVEHRVHHVQKKPKDWMSFNREMEKDQLYFWCFELITAMKNLHYKIIIITGRTNDFRMQTEEWLKRHNVHFDELYMRNIQDFREDADVKEEIYRQYVEEKNQVLFVVDDRESVVERWRKLELICLQCAPGKF